MKRAMLGSRHILWDKVRMSDVRRFLDLFFIFLENVTVNVGTCRGKKNVTREGIQGAI